jgi:glycosidase
MRSHRPPLQRLAVAWALAALCAGPAAAQVNSAAVPTATACRADPLAGRALYLRGSFNSWSAVDTQKFTWACNRWELVTRLQGEHAFKLADEGWSADADFGAAQAGVAPGTAPIRLALRGQEFRRRFDGVHRFTLRMQDDATPPQLQVDACADLAPASPLGDTQLFLRGTLNNWAAQDDFAFQFSCDAYYLNLKATGRHEFRVADAAWKDATTFGSTPDQKGNFTHEFSGEHTVRVAIVAGRALLSVGPKTFADPTATAVTDPVALSLRFDSRSAAHKQPFGAVPAGTALRFDVTALPGVEALTLVVETRRLEGNQEVLAYAETARLPMRRSANAADKAADKAAGRERFTASHRFDAVAVHGYWFEARIGGKLYALQNNADAVFWTREKGSGGLGAVVDKPAALQSVRRFRQTVFARDFTVPDWAQDAVYYYIFPDRYRNGDAANDPQTGVARYHQHTVELHKHWNEAPWRPGGLSGDVKGKGDGSDAHYNNDFFGGDLAGIIDKLDDIKDLGANVIYMTPIFRAASNHKYDTADYRQVDPAFGSNADFERLVREGAKRGIRVIPDASFNHTGADSLYFDRFGNFGGQGAFANGKINPASPYASWYSFDAKQPPGDRQFKGWVGIPDLPELNKASPAVRDFFIHAPDSITKLWLDRGAAGWRMDVAPWVPDDFWRAWRKAVKAHKPDALTVAETWFDASKYFLGDMFDSTMNYIFRNTVLAYANGGNAAELYRNIELMREAYPPQAFHALMNLISSHDQARALHHFGWLHDTHDAAVIAKAKQRLRLAVFFQMVFPGSPAIYYGDEVGVTGGDDPYNRATYPWPDLGGQPDLALRADVKRMVQLRHAHAVLRRGELDAPLLADAQVLVLARRLGPQLALTAMNNGDAPRTVRVALPAGSTARTLRDALTGAELPVRDGAVEFTVPALFGSVLLAQ